jgi:hypothetical protein
MRYGMSATRAAKRPAGYSEVMRAFLLRVPRANTEPRIFWMGMDPE